PFAGPVRLLPAFRRPERRGRMPDGSTAVDYKPDQRAAKTAGKPASAVEEFLQLLARAVRQFHTYPATSPLCTDAIAACHKLFATLDRERLELRVTPHEFMLDEAGIGARTIVEHELVRRLHHARV